MTSFLDEHNDTPPSWTKYWEQRWKNGETGFHQTDFESHMLHFFDHLPSTRIFVPLCGKSNDLLWFIQNGHEVIGVELSDLACLSFFEENLIPFKKGVQSGSNIYSGPKITLFNQDIFSLKAADCGKFGAIYDRAALIALPLELRSRYAQQIIRLVNDCTDSSLRFCQVLLERSPSDTNGPPFSVSESELHELYGKSFIISPISREFESQKGDQRTEECVFNLQRL